MTLLTLAFTLALALGPTQLDSNLVMSNLREAKSFCDVMKDPKLSRSKPITITATAKVLYGGILLNSDQCKAPDVSVHYFKGFEQESNAEALERIQKFQRQVHDAHLRNAGAAGEQITVGVVLEGRLEKNNLYRATFPEGDKTMAAWDYNDEYVFVVTRVVSVGQPN